MNAYIFQADIYCEDCAKDIKRRIVAPQFPDDDRTFDSDDYPKGPYPDGGGESDIAQHCGGCGVSLDNPVIGQKDGE